MLDISEIQDKYGNEVSAMILCCRVFFGSATTTQLSQFLENNIIDWPQFIRLARIHRIRPLVFKTIIKTNMPDNIKAQIRGWQLELVKSCLKITIETERVISLLKQNNVDLTPYKGVAYSKLFFGDHVSREISDIDLVIKPEDLAIACAVLANDGYEPELEDIHHLLGDKYFNFFKDYNLNKSKNGDREFHLELHWGVTENEIGVNPKASALLYDTGPNEVLAKTSVRMLSPMAHISAMLVHNTFKDNLLFIKNVVDISQAFKSEEIQNNGLMLTDRFKALGIRKSLSVNNTLSELLMGVSLPQIKTFGDSAQTANCFLNKLCLRQALLTGDGENMVVRVKHTALLQDSFIKKVGYYWLCLRFRFIPGRFDFRFVRLSPSLFFMYYLIKPFRTITQSLGKK